MNKAQIIPKSKSMARIVLLFMLFATVYLTLFVNSINLTWFQSNLDLFRNFTYNNFALAVFAFFFLRFIFAIISIPGSGVLTIMAGAVFDFFLASVLVTSSVSLGVLVIFLLSRYAFRDLIKSKFSKQIEMIDKISEKHGASLLFFVRITEIAPSFVINSLFALTPIKAKTYFWVSLAGLLPGILIFINAGHQISEINSLSDLMSWSLILSLAALGAIPLLSSIFYRRCYN